MRHQGGAAGLKTADRGFKSDIGTYYLQRKQCYQKMITELQKKFGSCKINCNLRFCKIVK